MNVDLFTDAQRYAGYIQYEPITSCHNKRLYFMWGWIAFSQIQHRMGSSNQNPFKSLLEPN